MFCNRKLLLGALLLLLPLAGCTRLLVSMGLMNDSAEVKHTAPAEEDLADTVTIAMATLSGNSEDTLTISAALGQLLAESGRFQLVERERFDELRRETGCAAPGDLSCVSRALPASAVLLGSVAPQHYNEHVETTHYECVKNQRKTLCYSHRRVGEATGSATLRLVDPASGKVLCQKLIAKRASAQSATVEDTDTPEPLDTFSLRDSVRREIAQEFFAAISPHPVMESVELETDSDLPELRQGNALLKKGALSAALKQYQAGVDRATAPGDLEAKTIARAHYALAVALAASERYDAALSSLREALALHPDEHWQKTQRRIASWKADAERAGRQLSFARVGQDPALARRD
jgi:tetratricopeptide (TPR) repeat protein